MLNPQHDFLKSAVEYIEIQFDRFFLTKVKFCSKILIKIKLVCLLKLSDII